MDHEPLANHVSPSSFSLFFRYLNLADEPDPRDREISFVVFYDNFSDAESFILQIEVVDDNPTMV